MQSTKDIECVTETIVKFSEAHRALADEFIFTFKSSCR